MKNKKIIIICIIVIALIQLIRIDKTNPNVDFEKDYLNLSSAPKEISDLIKNSCYDCHSYETKYPWYSNLAPISWLIKNHINEARENLNFSNWGDYSENAKIGIEEDCIYVLTDNEMPLKSYTLIHNKAKLSNENKATLLNWFDIEQRSPINN